MNHTPVQMRQVRNLDLAIHELKHAGKVFLGVAEEACANASPNLLIEDLESIRLGLDEWFYKLERWRDQISNELPF
jgi:hypothetical protein